MKVDGDSARIPGGPATALPSTELTPIVERLCAGEPLTRATSRAIFTRALAGAASEIELTALLIALKAKGETPDEIAGAAQAMREAAVPFDVGDLSVVDCCGTGGDGAATVNISTASALVAAELGLHVVKHGNRSVSSRCGSADVLERCGVPIDASVDSSRRALEGLRICFLMAPQYHPSVRHAMPVRRALKTRTIFNLLGPLVNPARPAVQLVGVYDPALCEPIATTLALLGCRTALVVHGGGLDEIALHGPTTAARLVDGAIEPLTITPEQLGLPTYPIEALTGGDPNHNARWLERLLAGKGDPAHADAVAANAGALFWLAGSATSLREGVAAARAAITSGKTAERLAAWTT